MRRIILIASIFCLGFFCFKIAFAVEGDTPRPPGTTLERGIVINEIAWMGTEVSSNDEWLELWNKSETELDLSGWRIVAMDGQPVIDLTGRVPANGYYLLERTDDDTVPGIVASQIYVGALGNDGEYLELINNLAEVIDCVDASVGWMAGDNTTKQTMERVFDGAWQTSLEAGGTPETSLVAEAASTTTSLLTLENMQNQSTTTSNTQNLNIEVVDEKTEESKYLFGDVVINELVSDPTDGEVEWVELYNTKNEAIDLAGWTLTEGSDTKTALLGSMAGSGSGKFFVIDKPKGNLNNGGDIVTLKDGTGNIIDKVVYGNWESGIVLDPAPVASDPNSLARVINGFNTFNNLNDFRVTKTPTKGKANIVTAEETETASLEEKSAFDYSEGIIIMEIFPNPKGADTEAEYIELYNSDTRSVNLCGWILGDASTKRYTIEDECLLGVGKYLVISRAKSKIALNNTSDTVKLFRPLEDEAWLAVSYAKAKEDWSYNLEEDNNWAWSEMITPGEINIVEKINHTPVVDFSWPVETSVGEPIFFDSSDSYDEDGDELKYAWDFGDGFENVLAMPEHTYFQPGIYTVSLEVSDGKTSVRQEKDLSLVAGLRDENTGESVLENIEIWINEFIPNPVGSDEEEFIEIYNTENVKVNLKGWSLDDDAGGSKAYVFTEDTWIEPRRYLVMAREDSKIALNNTGDAVRLFDPSEVLRDDIVYAKTYEGKSYARDLSGAWRWTEPTPDEANVFERDEDSEVVVSANTKASLAVKNYTVNTTLENIKNFEAGDKVRVRGTVAVCPGILGSQYFYIVGSPGLQVYSYKKDFPALSVGDYIEVEGELSLVNGEQRLKTKTKADINVLEKKEAPEALEISGDELDEERVGRLVKIAGEITEKKGSLVTLDDGLDEVPVYIKASTNIKLGNLKVGDKLAVVGIAGRTKTDIRVMPRSEADIIKMRAETEEEVKVLGEYLEASEWTLAGEERKSIYLKYGGFLLVLLAVVGGIGYYILKYKE